VYVLLVFRWQYICIVIVCMYVWVSASEKAVADFLELSLRKLPFGC